MTERGSARGFWLWVAGGVVVCIGAVVLLGTWFRIAPAVSAGWVVFAMNSFPQRQRLDLRSPRLWGVSAVGLLLAIGLALLLGAIGLSSDDERTDSPVPGAVLGGVLVAAGALGLFLAWRRQRRAAVDAEVEQYRAEERTPDASA
jgi:amino acid transporter